MTRHIKEKLTGRILNLNQFHSKKNDPKVRENFADTPPLFF